MLKQKKPFHCTKFVIAPVKGFWLVREMQECTTVLFHRKMTKNNHKNERKICYWKLVFVICSYSTWARRHAKQGMSTWPREHVDTLDTLAPEHVSKQSTLARE